MQGGSIYSAYFIIQQASGDPGPCVESGGTHTLSTELECIRVTLTHPASARVHLTLPFNICSCVVYYLCSFFVADRILQFSSEPV